LNLLILDNYDSFTYNLVHLVEKVSDLKFDVIRNDRILIQEVAQYDKILLSPGPGLPKDAGIMPELIKTYGATKHILGICLGMQAIGEAYGAKLKNLDTVVHGMATPVTVTTDSFLFTGCPQTFDAGRYHSWVVDPVQLPANLLVLATDHSENIMALQHSSHKVCGVQFHPESILSQYGETIIKNWVRS
jgi:anthranilate synthase component 2